MPPFPLKIRLTWKDSVTQDTRNPLLSLPIALGSEFSAMPANLGQLAVSRMTFRDPIASKFHAFIYLENNQPVIIDQNTPAGTWINNVRVQKHILRDHDVICLGNQEIRVRLVSQASSPTSASYQCANVPLNPPTSQPQTKPKFPPAAFKQAEYVSLDYLEETGRFNPRKDQFDYAAIGAGLGSYIWVDFLRIFGVKAERIVALGTQDKPYARYQQLCLNSQIPPHERLRSNSDSCPDNIWGWPSYALRESWQDFWKGRVNHTLESLWQVFSEPVLAETYTPKSGNVFKSIDREANRIGWSDIFRHGSVRAIRKMSDGRYAIAYSQGKGRYGFVVAKHIHLSTGYPGIRLLKHLKEYRDKTKDLKSVVNAYESHEHIYDSLVEQGGTVLIQGRGIVASRILQRIYETCQKSSHRIEVIHMMRRPIGRNEGNKFGLAQRSVSNHFELQPFNWPKACWGGDLRDVLEKASDSERTQLLKAWGGTTTADRRDWQRIIASGLRDQWYRPKFGSVKEVEPAGRQLKVTYSEVEGGKVQGVATREVDFIIDATGLEADLEVSPLLKDLIDCYSLQLLDNGRFKISNEFEIAEMCSKQTGQQPGHMYASGVITLGGPYAAVDSFLGLQYGALRSIDSLVKKRAPGLRRLNGLASLWQWYKWATYQKP
ncbi:hypothetical protein XM38_003990 [Halomicronema hongdechloris C2206]|uniref:FHA domain-containing protein n=1 Tax=Halomicronema hongdechloris C2206 TaxID=1641165 RepID=A0A1Z3HGM6_9CYAN|nr:FHA domain-containing protein [Halomicronema hongdechloris]ASC69472.1 hypothetical protein XM38_003990 [Halomicronema hongdechloris C2206]